MKRTNQIIFGIILVGIGLVLGLNAFGITDISIFFSGWWTLFIIVPSLIGLVSRKDITGNLIGLAIGVFLFLCCQDVLDFDMVWKLIFPAIIVIFGLKMVFGNRFDKVNAERIKQIESSNGSVCNGTAVFSGERMNFSGDLFNGAELNAVFGGLDCDIRNAVIEHDCVINASAVFGGIDIFVPNNINIKVSSNSFFGGVSNKASNYHNDSAPTLYIKGTCLFGGVDIK